ncbi:hypothetical protein IEQ34_002692 [Dendrobium chrysotoxum]|uniref:LAGLIDADG homing endonuclease n=1 Tax=Dendrobium chrysotoxum TaxID=161865 RepID=A0AAV7HII5_DENCH|nr:hypothetical protein IEQ34_002692 [Dendrobium chrysotoxum]
MISKSSKIYIFRSLGHRCEKPQKGQVSRGLDRSRPFDFLSFSIGWLGVSDGVNRWLINSTLHVKIPYAAAVLAPIIANDWRRCESDTLSLGYIDLKVGFQRGKDTPLGDSPYPFETPNLDYFTTQSGKSNLPLKGRVLFSIWVSDHEESKELEEEKTEELKIESIPLKDTCVCIRIRIRAPPRLRVLADHLAYEGAVLSKGICASLG